MFYDGGMTLEQLAAITDVQTLRQLVAEQLGTIADRQRIIEAHTRALASKQQHIDALTLEVARLRRLRFAARSEAMNAVHRDLFEDAMAEEIGAVEQALEQAGAGTRPARTARSAPKRAPLPAHLPRETHVHEPARCDCPQCHGALNRIGEHVSEKLAVKPLTFYVERHVYPQYACRACETVVAEPVAAALIERGQAAPSLLAQVVIGKYGDHLPLYRQQAQYLRAGVELARSTLAEWVGAVGLALEPLVDRLRHRLREQPILHADETPVATLDPGSGKTRRSYLFAYRSTAGPPIVVFDYAESRGGKHARAFLGAWRGALMVDDYAGYKALFQDGVTELACWVHVRRKFVEVAQHSDSPLAHEAVRRIAQLYRIEADARDLEPAARTAYRQAQAGPVLAALHTWLIEVSVRQLGGSSLAKAVNHALGRWPALLRYLDDGAHPIDNNPVENAIRPIALGRKNWLFIGATRAGPRAAAIMSLIATAKANGLCPHAWLTDVLTRLPTTKQRDIDTLLPIEGWQPRIG
jgi:transposase